jgi:hypothetical protein
VSQLPHALQQPAVLGHPGSRGEVPYVQCCCQHDGRATGSAQLVLKGVMVQICCLTCRDRPCKVLLTWSWNRSWLTYWLLLGVRIIFVWQLCGVTTSRRGTPVLGWCDLCCVIYGTKPTVSSPPSDFHKGQAQTASKALQCYATAAPHSKIRVRVRVVGPSASSAEAGPNLFKQAKTRHLTKQC